jgi:hypothetical protein
MVRQLVAFLAGAVTSALAQATGGGAGGQASGGATPAPSAPGASQSVSGLDEFLVDHFRDRAGGACRNLRGRSAPTPLGDEAERAPRHREKATSLSGPSGWIGETSRPHSIFAILDKDQLRETPSFHGTLRG